MELLLRARLHGLGDRLVELKGRREELLAESALQDSTPLSEGELSKIAAGIWEAMTSGSPAKLKAVAQEFVHEIRVENRQAIYPVFLLPCQEKVRALYGLVERTHHNANNLDLGSDQVQVVWTNRFHEPEPSAPRSEIQKRRHASDPEFHRNSLEILKRSRETRFWSEERILEAIRAFRSRMGRPPSYNDFRKTKTLPDYATLWKRFGSIRVAISLALDGDGQKRPTSKKMAA